MSRRGRNDRQNQQILTASVRDLRHFATLLRGVNFANRALVQVNEVGIVVTVEEARSLLGVAYIHKDVFDEFVFHPLIPPEAHPEDQDPDPPANTASQSQDPDQVSTHTVFEIPLNTLIECLNVFGTAGAPAMNSATHQRKYRGWRNSGQDSDSGSGDEGDAGGRRGGGSARSGRTNVVTASGNNRIERYFGTEKGTGMRMSYAGEGRPLTLLVAEDANGPTATCEVTTFDAEPVLDLPYDAESTVLKIILKSSWLLDALSELHPSCETLTIIGNPPPPSGRTPNTSAPPRLRLKATGTFGTSEMDYPNDKEVLETCECPAPVSFTYRASHISRTIRALQSSLKASLRIDEEGLMSLQLMVPAVGARGKVSDAFIEFRCLAIDESAQE